jgi:Ca-activated chloride channel homolog
VLRADGSAEERTAPIRVDTTPAALAVLAAPARVRPGERFTVAMKPALPAARLPALASRPGGLAAAVKGAIEVKEVLVRAPWGEIATARLEGAAGIWRAELRAPPDGAPGAGELELVASDAAGNVARRRLPIAVDDAPVRPGEGTDGLGLLAALLLCTACGLAWLRA